MEPYTNRAAASHNIPAEKPELFDYYFQIPEKAELKKIPISKLSPSVQKRIMRLDGCTKIPYVIVVSPITMQKFPNGQKTKSSAAKAAAERSQVTFSHQNQSSDGRSTTGIDDKWTRRDHGTYLVPVKCCKNTALSILQLSQTRDEEKMSPESELQTFSDSLVLNLQVIKMKAAALCMYKNMMYLLPESKKTDASDEKSELQEKVAESEATELHPGTVDCRAEESKKEIVPKNSQQKIKELSTDSEQRHNGLGCVTLRRLSVLQVGATVVKLWNEDIWDLPAEVNSTSPSSSSSPSSRSSTSNSPSSRSSTSSSPSSRSSTSNSPSSRSSSSTSPSSGSSTSADPSSGSSTENNLQISFWEHSERQIKRKLSSVDSGETCIKKVNLSGSDAKQDSTVARKVVTHSPLHLHLSSDAPSPLGPHESPLSFSPADSSSNGKSVDLDEVSSCSSNLLCNIPPHMAPTLQESGITFEDGASPPHLEARSSPSLSDITSSENSNEPEETTSSSEPSPMFNDRSEHASVLDMDDTTRDERAQRLLDRVRELNKIVDNMRQREKLS